MVSWWPEVTLALRFPQRRCSWPRRWWLVDVTGRGNPSSVPHRLVQYRIHVLCRSVQKWCHCSIICDTNPKLELTSHHEMLIIWFKICLGERKNYFFILNWIHVQWVYFLLTTFCFCCVIDMKLSLLLVTNIYRKKWENLKLCKKISC